MIYTSHPRKGDDAYGTFDDLEAVVRDAAKALRPRLDEFDSIVVTGMSGVVVGAPLALRLRKPLGIIRKKDDDAHSHRRVLNKKRLGRRAIWVDDLIASGATKRRVEAELEAVNGPEMVGYYLYDHDKLSLWGPSAGDGAGHAGGPAAH